MSFTVVYLSETGVGQTIGERIHREASSHGMTCNLFSAADFAKVDWKETKVFVFIASSTGDGDPPEKALKFWRWSKQDDQKDLLRGSSFALLGLGDSNYSSFMSVPRKLHTQISSHLGASVFLPKTEADDATPSGLESTIEPWLDSLWPALKKQLQKGDAQGANSDSVASGTAASAIASAGGAGSAVASDKHPRLPEIVFGVVPASRPVLGSQKEPDAISAQIVGARYLSSKDALKTVVHLTLSGPFPAYLPGDTITIRCPNPIEDVLFVLSRLSLAEQKVIECSTKGLEFWPGHVPQVVDAFQALSWYVDLCALPSKRLLRALAEDCRSPFDRKKMMDLCEISATGKEKYAELSDSCQGLAGVLQSIPSCQPSLAMLLALLPVMKPRSYSVASVGTDLEIVFTIFQKGSSGLFGACTSWLQRLAQLDGAFLADRKKDERPDLKQLLSRQLGHWHNSDPCLFVPVRFSPPTRFRLQDLAMNEPIVLVCAGTGIAPFRAFFQLIEKVQKSHPGSFPDVQLYFGCRNRNHDFLFGDELERWHKIGVISKLHVATSRQDPGQVTYVQHMMEKDKEILAGSLIGKGGFVFVCGDALKLAPAVESTVLHILTHSTKSEVESRLILAKMKEANRYCVDVWA